MKFNIKKKLLLVIITPIFLIGCSQNKSIDIDLSDLPKPKKIKITNKADQINQKPLVKELIRDLVPLKDREQVLANFKFGKKDPFSMFETQPKVNPFSSNFELTGFLNTEKRKYVFVKYLGNEGIISEDSIGGLNTEFLPDGAKVITIDPKRKQLKINLENKDFTFEL